MGKGSVCEYQAVTPLRVPVDSNEIISPVHHYGMLPDRDLQHQIPKSLTEVACQTHLGQQFQIGCREIRWSIEFDALEDLLETLEDIRRGCSLGTTASPGPGFTTCWTTASPRRRPCWPTWPTSGVSPRPGPSRNDWRPPAPPRCWPTWPGSARPCNVSHAARRRSQASAFGSSHGNHSRARRSGDNRT